MRIAYVANDPCPAPACDVWAYLEHVTRSMALAGHAVYLLSNHVPQDATRRISAGVQCLQLLAGDPSRRYFSPQHQNADRVYETLLRLNGRTPLDAIEFAHAGAEGFTTVRAKRLLGEFPGTQLVVRVHDPADLRPEASGERCLTPERSIQRYAEDYCARHADAVTAPSVATADLARERFGISRVFATRSPYLVEGPAPRLPPVKDLHHIRFLGDLHPVHGADIFLQAALRLLQRDASFTFTLAGRDTPSDPFRDSYCAFLQRRIPPRFRHCFKFEETRPYAAARDLPRRSICVFMSDWGECTYDLLAAMLSGSIVVASRRGAAGELVCHERSGLLVDSADPDALAEALFTLVQDPAPARRLAASAQARARRWSDPSAVCSKLLASYRAATVAPTRSAPARKAHVPVSVVIPLYNQGQHVLDAVQSVRASTYRDVEIVVVNDGSTDPETNRTFAALDRVKKISQPNLGLGSARNTGILASSGDMILTLDADDVIHPEYIVTAVHALLRNPDLSYVTCYTRNFGVLTSSYVPVGSVPDLMLFLHTDGKSSSLYRKRTLVEIGGYDPMMPGFEDWEMQIRMNKNGFIGDVLPRELFYYRRHLNSMVFTKSNFKRIELLQYMLLKHQDLLARDYLNVALQLVYLWKNKYEASESVALQEQSYTWLTMGPNDEDRPDAPRHVAHSAQIPAAPPPLRLDQTALRSTPAPEMPTGSTSAPHSGSPAELLGILPLRNA